MQSQISRRTKYFLSLFSGAIIALFAYIFLIHNFAIPDRNVSRIDYRNLLFEKIKGPRIIIDSGSNSFWSITPELLINEFNRPAFVIAENANVPIEMKLRRLKKYAKQGDLIILPLEWVYYNHRTPSSDFTKNLLGINIFKEDDDKINLDYNIMLNSGYHYYLMSPIERFLFIIQNVNLNYIIKAIYQRAIEPTLTVQLGMKINLLKNIFVNSTWGDVKNDLNRKHATSEALLSCKDYIAAYPLTDLSAVRYIAHELKEIKKITGSDIFITWPAVAGEECYDETALIQLTSQIKEALESERITILGEPKDSYFAPEHTLDTYYHIDSQAAKIRTEKLINAIFTKNITMSKFYKKRDFKNEIDNILEAKIAEINYDIHQLEKSNAKNLLPINDGTYYVNDSFFNFYFQPLPSGWYEKEPWGMWSKGILSLIYLKPTNKPCRVQFYGNSFGKSSTSISTDKEQSSSISVSSSILIPTSKDQEAVFFFHENLISPKDMSINDDHRLLGFALTHISVACNK
jgi:hypothetical protein